MAAVAFERGALEGYTSRAQWDAAAAEVVSTMLDRWRLTAGDAFVGGYSAAVIDVTRDDGSPAVLKVGYPHFEAVYEAVALEALGAAAPDVYAQDPWTWSMLLERVVPGSPLSAFTGSTGDALAIACEMQRSVASTPPPSELPSLADGMAIYSAAARARFARDLPDIERMDAASLVLSALDELDALAAEPAEPVLLHGDFNPGNLLSSGQSWRIIDPKPLIGDAAFDFWPMVQQLGDPLSAESVAGRLAIVGELSGLDPRRIGRWGLARLGLNVSWYLDDGEPARAEASVAELRVWHEAQVALAVSAP